MGKIQQRIFRKDIDKELTKLVDKEVNIVLNSGKTICGTVKFLGDNKLVILDYFLNKHHVALAEIEEIVLDFAASN